jgi:SAM-dependent methyltransferase
MGDNKSDKGSEDIHNSWHNYTLLYYKMFEGLRDKPLRIFELGLGTNNINIPSNMGIHGRPGASLYGWAEFFPNATVFGADIDKDVLFQTDRIKTYYCDQTNPAVIAAMWRSPGLEEPFDIIIEDGLHEYHANICFFESSIHKLKDGGIYVIEDVDNNSIPKWEVQLNSWRQLYPGYIFNIAILNSKVNNWDNNLIIIQKAAHTQ